MCHSEYKMHPHLYTVVSIPVERGGVGVGGAFNKMVMMHYAMVIFI